MKVRVLTAMVFVVAIATFVYAQSVDGTWTGQIQGGRRGPQDVSLTLKASGATVTGSMKTGQGEAQVEEGKFEGGTLSFKTKQSFGDNTITFTYSGKVSGDELMLTRNVEGGGGGGGGRGGRGGGPQEFTLKRQK